MKPRSLDALTGVRFFAAAAIVAFHLNMSLLGPFSKAVSLFYVLSGFILYHVHRGLRPEGDAAFLAARFARIWPLHAATFVLAVAFVPVIFGVGHWPIVAPLNLLLVQAWVPTFLVAFSFNGVAWSISVEAFFYACFPFLVRRLERRPGATLAGAFAVSVGAALAGWALLPNVPGFKPVSAQAFLLAFPPVRLFEFVLGMAAGWAWNLLPPPRGGNTLAWTSAEAGAVLAAIVPPFAAEWARVRLPSSYTYLGEWAGAVLGAPFLALLLGVLAWERGLLSRLLRTRLLVYLGEVSFAIYMVHALMLSFLATRGWFGLAPGLRTAAFLAATLGMACLLHHAVDVPCRAAIRGWFARKAGAGRSGRGGTTRTPSSRRAG